MDRETAVRSQNLADAVPFYGEGAPIPQSRDLSAKDDTSGFNAVVILLARSWPYISPQVLGRWWMPGVGVEERVAELIRGRGYSFVYMPLLVTILAVLLPYCSIVPITSEYPYNLLYPLILLAVIFSWPLPNLTGRVQIVSLVLVMLSLALANMISIVLIEGSGAAIYTGALSFACLLGWFVQIRIAPTSVKFRIRVGSHLIYYYGLEAFKGLGVLFIGLITAEIINQSVLQNEPLMPGLSALLGYPSMSADALGALSETQRMELRWAPIKIELLWFLILWPLDIFLLYYIVWVFQRINHDLRLALVDHWHQLSLRHHADHRVGDSIWRIQSDSETVTHVLKVLGELAVMFVNVVVTAALVSILSPLLGLIILFTLLPTFLVARWAMPRFRTRSLVQRMANADLTSKVQESFRSIKLTKAYEAGERSQASFEEDSMIAFNAEYRNERLGFRVSVMTESYSAVLIFGGVCLMALWSGSSQPTFATELIALAGLTFVVWNLSAYQWTRERYEGAVGLIVEIMRLWGWAQDVAMGLRRVFDILDMQPEVRDKQNAIPFEKFENEIRFKDVAFAYSPERPVLDGVNLCAAPGTITAIVGPTGSGKSTLVNLLLRLFDPDRGVISIDGKDIRDYSVESLRKHIAIALQENVLFGMTIRDNIRYAAPDADEERVNEAVRIACLQETIETMPDGLDTMLGDRGGRLSVGQRQRISIARAIIRDTPILLLDEPTASLDADTEHRVLENLREWSKTNDASKRAIFLITHRISTIRRADEILFLESGKVVESGDHQKLMTIEGGLYRSFVRAESGDTLLD